MNPTAVCCPKLACPARGQAGKGTIGVHARTDQRFIGQPCRKTVTATTGTAFYRLRTSGELVVIVVTLRAHGCPLQAIVAACGVEARTVAAWWARAGRQGQAVQAHLVEPPLDLGQVPAEDMRVKPQGGIVWMALALMVKTRLWLGGEVSAPREMTLIRRLMGRVRRCAAHRPLVVCTDGLCSYSRAMRLTCRDPVHAGTTGCPRWRPWRNVGLAPVVKRYVRRRVVDVERHMVDGTLGRVETRRRRSQGDGVSTTADSERLNATCRERWAPRARRCRALARRPLTLEHGLDLVGTLDHFCTPPERLRHRNRAHTPAMAARITDHGWTVQALLAFHVPPPRWTPPKRRGRPSRVVHCRVERWSS